MPPRTKAKRARATAADVPSAGGRDENKTAEKAPFNVKKHLIRVNGGREYLPVAYRLVWFRQDHPDWGIETEALVCDPERGIFVFGARVTDGQGRHLAAGSKMQTTRGFADACEKAETGAIGRALGVLLYGTHFCPEFEDGETLAGQPAPYGNGQSAGNWAQPSTCAEEGCGRPLTKGQHNFSAARFGKPLCPLHQPRDSPAKERLAM